MTWLRKEPSSARLTMAATPSASTSAIHIGRDLGNQHPSPHSKQAQTLKHSFNLCIHKKQLPRKGKKTTACSASLHTTRTPFCATEACCDRACKPHSTFLPGMKKMVLTHTVTETVKNNPNPKHRLIRATLILELSQSEQPPTPALSQSEQPQPRP